MNYLTEIFLLFYAGLFAVGGANIRTRLLGSVGIVVAVIGFIK